MLELRSLSMQAGNFLIKDVSLSVPEGQCHIIIGPTGSGKTLLLESVIGFRKPDRGKILLAGRNINKEAVEKRGIAYVPQDPSIFPHLTVEENILYGVRIKKTETGMCRDLVGKLVESLRISHLLKRRAVNLSGGEQQRVALVRALAAGDRYLLLDEPLSSLHESLKKELWFFLRELQTRYKLTILMVTHDLEEAFFLADGMSIIINGKLHQTGKKQEIYSMPETMEAAKFLGVRNLLPAEVIRLDESILTVHCAHLGRDLVVRQGGDETKRRVKMGEKVIAGIRAEEAMVLRPEYYKHNEDNMIEGTVVEIVDKGASYTVLFLPDGSRQHIEVEIPNYALKKIQLARGEKRFIVLRSENIFLLKR